MKSQLSGASYDYTARKEGLCIRYRPGSDVNRLSGVHEMNVIAMGDRDKCRFRTKVNLHKEAQFFLRGASKSVRVFVYLKVMGAQHVTSVKELSEDLSMKTEEVWAALQQLRAEGLVETKKVEG